MNIEITEYQKECLVTPHNMYIDKDTYISTNICTYIHTYIYAHLI